VDLAVRAGMIMNRFISILIAEGLITEGPEMA
jgi:hypothetical protein